MKNMISQKLSLLCLILAGTLILNSCSEKKPTASFTTDKSTYDPGESIKINNGSEDAASYKWTFSDGQTFTDESPTYVVPNTGLTSLTIKLEAISKKGKEKDETSQTVTITTTPVQKYGSAIFWKKTGSNFGIVDVQIDGVFESILVDNSTAPNCGTSGPATFDSLTTGNHYYNANNGTQTWTGTVVITDDGCTQTELK